MRQFGIRKGSGAHVEGSGQSPTKLVMAGAIGLLLFGGTFLLSTANAVQTIDSASLADETSRATVAVEVAIPNGAALTTALAQRLDHDFGLDGARFTETAALAPDEISIAVAEGMVTKELAWTPRRFASEAFAQIAPMRLVSAAGILAAVTFILFRLSKVAKDLEVRRAAARALAGRDALTGLDNRLTFEENLHKAFEAQAADARGPALFYLDLDDFKPVNDTLGHAAGDHLLRMVGERLLAVASPTDSVARLGGDEFALIRRTGLSRGDLADFAHLIHKTLCQPFHIEGTDVVVGVSMGIAIKPDHADTPEQLVREADAALYRAKARADAYFLFAANRELPAAKGAAPRHAA